MASELRRFPCTPPEGKTYLHFRNPGASDGIEAYVKVANVTVRNSAGRQVPEVGAKEEESQTLIRRVLWVRLNDPLHYSRLITAAQIFRLGPGG